VTCSFPFRIKKIIIAHTAAQSCRLLIKSHETLSSFLHLKKVFLSDQLHEILIEYFPFLRVLLNECVRWSHLHQR
jgi:hypothetical protein